MCFDSSCLSCVLVRALVVSEVLFAEVVCAAEMALISATKYGPFVVAPPVSTGPPGVVRVGKHRSKFFLSPPPRWHVGCSQECCSYQIGFSITCIMC